MELCNLWAHNLIMRIRYWYVYWRGTHTRMTHLYLKWLEPEVSGSNYRPAALVQIFFYIFHFWSALFRVIPLKVQGPPWGGTPFRFISKFEICKFELILEWLIKEILIKNNGHHHTNSRSTSSVHDCFGRVRPNCMADSSVSSRCNTV